jgi:hypothetical protein
VSDSFKSTLCGSQFLSGLPNRQCCCTRKDRCRQIAQKHTPSDVRAIPVQETGDRHRGRSWVNYRDAEGFRVMEVPTPDTLEQLWIYLHECAHMKMHWDIPAGIQPPSRLQAEADLEVMRIFDEEGLVAPLQVLRTNLDALCSVAFGEGRLPKKEGQEMDASQTVIEECRDEFRRRIAVERQPDASPFLRRTQAIRLLTTRILLERCERAGWIKATTRQARLVLYLRVEVMAAIYRISQGEYP